MDEKVEQLIKQGLINLSREKRLHKKIIEKISLEDEIGLEYLRNLYRECSEKTALIIDEIFKAGNFSEDELTEMVLGSCAELEENNDASYSAGAFLDVMKSQYKLCQPTSKMYVAKKSVSGEYDVILYELKFKSLLNGAKSIEEKDKILDELAEGTLKDEVFRQLFRGNYELSDALCNPNLFFSNDYIAYGLKLFGERSVIKLLERISDPKMSILMGILGSNPVLREVCCTPLIEGAMFQIAAVNVQLKKHGKELVIPEELLTDTTRPVLEGALKLTNKYYESRKEKVLKK